MEKENKKEMKKAKKHLKMAKEMISLVLYIDLEPPVRHALWKLLTASRPLSLIS